MSGQRKTDLLDRMITLKPFLVESDSLGARKFTQSRIGPENKYFKLYVRSIPSDFDEDTLRNLFLYFGNPLEIYYRHSGDGPGWAFVSYGTLKEAELAIRELSDRAPYFIKVQFAFTPEEKERILEERSRDGLRMSILESESHLADTRRCSPIYDGKCGRGRGIAFPFQRQRPAKLEEMVFKDYDDLRGVGYYERFPRDYQENAYDEKPETGILHTMKPPQIPIPRQGHVIILAPEGVYDIREYPEKIKCKIREKLEILCTRVTGDFLDSRVSVNSVKQDLVEKCIACGKLTTCLCQRCRSAYCSRECQISDWHHHKSKCVPIIVPTVTSALEINSAPVLSVNHMSEIQKHLDQKYKQDEEKGKRQYKSTLSNENNYSDKNNGFVNRSRLSQRQIYDSEDVGEVRSEFERSKNYSSFNPIKRGTRSSVNDRLKIRQSAFNENSSTGTYRDRIVPVLKPSLPTTNLFSKEENKVDIRTRSEMYNKQDILDAEACNFKISEETAMSEDGKLSKFSFKKVKVTVVIGPLECWVQLEESNTKLLEIMTALNISTDELPVQGLKQGMICAALYENLWYRVRVICVEPEVKVLYIDFGNEEHCTPNQLRPLPTGLENIPALALRIKLAKGTLRKFETLSEEEILNVKCVDVSGDVIIVHAEGEEYPENYSKKCSLRRPKENVEFGDLKDYVTAAVLNLKVGMKGGCQFRHELNSNDFGVTIVYPELKEKFAKLFAALISKKNEKYRPSIGETVAVFMQDGSPESWMRGRILAIDDIGYRVNLVDLGFITTANTIEKLPEDLKSLPEFGSRCTFMNYVMPRSESWCKEEKRFRFVVTAVDNLLGCVTCNLLSDDGEVGTIILKRWIPELCDFNTVSLKNGDKVVLSVYFGHNSLYLRPVGNYFQEKLSKLDQDLTYYCMSAPDMDHIPGKDEIVASKFLDDGKYYRARVLQADKDSIKVVYLDFGNVDSVDQTRLKPLSTELQEIPAMAVKVSLKGVAEKPVTESVACLLTGLIAKETEMKILISGSLKNGIELILPDGRNLNDEINKLFCPESIGKLPEEKPKENILTESDIKYLKLPIGNTVQLVVLHKIDSTSLMACESNGEVVSHVLGAMGEEVNKYCNSTCEKSYEPQLRELCLAKFEDGVWYRGICIDNDSSASKDNILFIDFGNTSYVKNINIRKMTEEFIKVPAVGVLCSLKGAENINEVQKKQLEKLIESNKMYEAHIVSCDGNGSYIVEFPHVANIMKRN